MTKSSQSFSITIHPPVFIFKSLQQNPHHSDILHCTMRCGWLEGVLSLDGTLGKKEQQKRKLFFLINLAMLGIQVVVSFVLLNAPLMTQVGSVLASAIALFSVMTVLCRRKVTNTLVVAVSYPYLLAVVLTDLGSRHWAVPPGICSSW